MIHVYFVIHKTLHPIGTLLKRAGASFEEAWTRTLILNFSFGMLIQLLPGREYYRNFSKQGNTRHNVIQLLHGANEVRVGK